MRALGLVLLVPLLVVVLLCSLPFSAAGSRWLLQRVDDLEVLDIGYGAGSLAGDLQLSHLRLSVAGVDVALTDISLRLERGCLLRSEFCFSYLHAGTLEVDVTEAALAGESEEDDSLVAMPYPLRSADIRLEQARVSWPGGHWAQTGMRGAASFVGPLLQIESAELAEGRLVIDTDDSDEPYTGFEAVRVFLPLEIEVGQLSLARASMDLAGWRSELEQLALAGGWHGTLLELESLGAGSFGSAERVLQGVQGSGQLDFSAHWPTRWQLAAQTDMALSPGAVERRRLSAAVDGDFAALAVELRSAGEPDISLSASLNILQAGLPFSAAAQLAWPDGARLAAIGPGVPEALADLQLSGPLQLNASGDLETQSLLLSAQARGAAYSDLQLSGQAQWLAGELEIQSLALRDSASQSDLAFRGRLVPGETWTVDGSVVSEGLVLPQGSLSAAPEFLRGTARLRAEGRGEQWQLWLSGLDIQGRVKGMPARLHGHAGINSALDPLPAQLQGEFNGAQLSLRIDEQADTPDEFRLAVDDLGRWVSDARGSLVLWGRGQLATGRVLIGGEASGIQLEQLDLPTASLDGEWQRQGKRLRLELQAPELAYGLRQLQQLSLQVAGSGPAHTIDISTAGDLETHLSVAGSLAEDWGWRGVLAPLELGTPSGPWHLYEPVELQWQAGGEALLVSPHCWRHPDFDLCARTARLGADGELDLQLTGEVSAFNGLLRVDMRLLGQLEARLAARWGEGRSLQLAAHGEAHDVRITRLFGLGESATLSWDLAQVDVQRGEDRRLALSGSIQRNGRRVVALEASLPPEPEGEMQGALQLDQLQVSAFAPWATLFTDLGGAVSGNLRLAGSLEAPAVFGQLQLREGNLLLEGNPTVLTGLDLTLALDGHGGRLEGAGLLGEGPLRLQGDFDWRPGLSFALSVEGEGQRILLPPVSEVTIEEKLRLAYSGDTLDLRGEMRVREGILRHEELPEDSVALSPDVVEVDPAGNSLGAERPFKVHADLKLYIDDRFEVRGSNIQAVLGGALSLEQEPGVSPQLYGSLNIAGGELRAYRQRLEIRRGRVDFTGPLQNPGLDVTAERRIRADDVTVGAHLFGTLEAPQMEIYSDPPMSQGEAMSYLIRGRGLDTGASADGTALALAVGADVVNQSGVVTGLNRLPLVNNVAFGSSGEEDETAATVGGYLGDRIYLSYGVGLYEPINEFTARLYLQSRLWLEVVSRLENSVDLYYSFDID